MNKPRRNWRFLAALFALPVLLATACGGSDNTRGASTDDPAVAAVPQSTMLGLKPTGLPSRTDDPAVAAVPQSPLETLSGTVSISGSSTVEPVSVRVAELFSAEVTKNLNLFVEAPGTGDGFKQFCVGDTDISNASRKIRSQEKESCEEARISWIELRVGIDGIGVMTNEGNDAIDCLSFEDLYAIVGPESEGFDNWADAASLASELGSSTSFPDEDLVIIAPGAESGTYDSFIEIVLEDIGDARAQAGMISEDQSATTRPDYRSSADDNVILQGISGSSGSLGWTGFAYVANASGVKLLEVDGGDGCVPANPDTIASGEYPVSRSLYIYVNARSAKTNPVVKAYVDFYMSDRGLIEAVSEVGYVQLAPDERAATRAKWNDWSEIVIGS